MIMVIMVIMLLVIIIMMIMVTMMHDHVDHGDYVAGDDYYLNFTKDGFPLVNFNLCRLGSMIFCL